MIEFPAATTATADYASFTFASDAMLCLSSTLRLSERTTRETLEVHETARQEGNRPDSHQKSLQKCFQSKRRYQRPDSHQTSSQKCFQSKRRYQRQWWVDEESGMVIRARLGKAGLGVGVGGPKLSGGPCPDRPGGGGAAATPSAAAEGPGSRTSEKSCLRRDEAIGCAAFGAGCRCRSGRGRCRCSAGASP